MTTVKDITKAIEGISRRHDLWKVWCDFTQLSATSLANAVDRRPEVWRAREDAYLQTAASYTREELDRFCQTFALVVDGLSVDHPGDLLGQAYMQLELGNKWAGQFFTPDGLSRALAAITLGDEVLAKIERQGFVTISEPSVGGGATVIALADQLRDRGVNYQKCMHVTAVDVDIKSVYMAYIQFSLLHIPAVIVHGNTLTLQEWSHWYTPAHILDGWGIKLRARANRGEDPEPVSIPMPESPTDQMLMF